MHRSSHSLLSDTQVVFISPSIMDSLWLLNQYEGIVQVGHSCLMVILTESFLILHYYHCANTIPHNILARAW